MFCMHCGKELPNDAAFCTNCGKKIASLETKTRPESTQELPNITPPISQQNDSGTNFNKNLIGKIILFLIIVGGLEHIKLVMFSQPVQQIKEFPLHIKIESKKTESKSNTIKKDDSETVKQPEVAQNPANNNVPVVPPQQNSEEHYPGSDVYPSGTMRHRITGTDVNMRSGPGRNYDVIGSFDKGEIVVEIEYELSKDSWAKVRRRNGKTGWVSGRYCEMVKEPQINYPMYIAATEALYDFHIAITKKDYRKAYNNLLAPDMQRYIGPYDKFVQGYSTTISSSVEETNPISTDGSTVVMEYLLEAKDQLQSGISVQFYKGTAYLQKVNGVWKIVEITAKKTDRNTLLN